MFGDLEDLIKKNVCTAHFLGHFYTYIPNYPHTINRLNDLSDIDRFTSVFSRHVNRCMYYGQNFVNHVSQIIEREKAKNGIVLQRVVVRVADAPYYDFDAFIFGCKSILEGKTIERSKCFHVDVKKAFDAYSKVVLSTFIKPVLLKLRNEVTHLDNFGSSIGSMMVIENGEYKFQAFDYNDDTELVTLFRKVLAEMTKIIHQVASFIMLDECMRWGYPSMDHAYTFEDYTLKVSDFVKLP